VAKKGTSTVSTTTSKKTGPKTSTTASNTHTGASSTYTTSSTTYTTSSITYTSVTLTSTYASSTTTSKTSTNTLPSYTIFIDGSRIKAKNSFTGKIDYEGTDAASVIQNTIDSLGKDGGKIFLTAGTYQVKQIVVAQSGITVDADVGAILIATDEGITTRNFPARATHDPVYGEKTEIVVSAPIILVDQATRVTLKNLIIDGNPMSRTFYRDGILVWDSSGVLIEACDIRNVEGNGIRVRSSGTYNLDNPESSALKTSDITIRGCEVHDTRTNVVGTFVLKAFGYDIEFSERVNIEGSVAEGTQESSFRSHYSRHVLFSGNTAKPIHRVTTGEAFDMYRSDDITIRGNKISEPAAVYVYEYVRNLLVENNDMTGSAGSEVQVNLQGIEGYRTCPIENVWFRSNTMTGSIHLPNSYLKNLYFERNVFYRMRSWPGSEMPRVHDNINFNSNAFLVRDDIAATANIPINFTANKFYNRVEVSGSAAGAVTFQTNEFTSDGASYAVGIFIGGSVPKVSIVGNNFHDITYQAIFATVGPGLYQNGQIEMDHNNFKRNGFVGPQDTVLIQMNSVNSIRATNNYFDSTPGTFTMNLGNASGEATMNVIDKPIYWKT